MQYSREAKKTAIITETEGWAQNGGDCNPLSNSPRKFGRDENLRLPIASDRLAIRLA